MGHSLACTSGSAYCFLSWCKWLFITRFSAGRSSLLWLLLTFFFFVLILFLVIRIVFFRSYGCFLRGSSRWFRALWNDFLCLFLRRLVRSRSDSLFLLFFLLLIGFGWGILIAFIAVFITSLDFYLTAARTRSSLGRSCSCSSLFSSSNSNSTLFQRLLTTTFTLHRNYLFWFFAIIAIVTFFLGLWFLVRWLRLVFRWFAPSTFLQSSSSCSCTSSSRLFNLSYFLFLFVIWLFFDIIVVFIAITMTVATLDHL